MDFFQITILSLVQGITEFLPISSSAHLALAPSLVGWHNQGQLLDVALHVGTLGAILIYFIKDVFKMSAGFFHVLRGKKTEGSRLFCNMIIGSIPVIIVGFIIKSYGFSFRSMTLMAVNLGCFGVLMGIADRAGTTGNHLNAMTGTQALLIGMGQSLALIPGVSRSGICLTFSRILGFARPDAARFTFLLAIPAISGAACLTGFEAYKTGKLMALNHDLFWLMGGSFVVGLLAIHFIMRYLCSGTLMPFAIYRVILGILLYLLATGHSLVAFLPPLL